MLEVLRVSTEDLSGYVERESSDKRVSVAKAPALPLLIEQHFAH
jgi:hypothetical protein